MNKLPYPLPIEAPHKIGLIGPAVLEKMLNIVNNGQKTNTGAWVHYKLTDEPLALKGELNYKN